MPIKNVTDRTRYQRAGKIYLGIRVKTPYDCKCIEKKKPKKDCFVCLGTGKVHRPEETPFFILKESQVSELFEHYGNNPMELNIILPKSWDLEQIFPQYLKLYGFGGLKCVGNGEKASFVNPKTKKLDEKPCPCELFEKGDCAARAIFNFRITERENTMFVYQVTTGSYNSIMNINAAIREIVWFSLTNRIDISDIKLKLKRVPQTTQRIDEKSGKVARSIHYPLTLDLDPRFYESWRDVITKSLPLPKRRPVAELPAPDVETDDLICPEVEEEKVIEEAHRSAMKEATKTVIEKEKEEKVEKVEKKAPPSEKKAPESTPVPRSESDATPESQRIPPEEKEDEAFKKVEEEVKERDKLMKELNTLLARLAGLGYQTNDEEQKRIMSIKSLDDYRKEIKYFKNKLESVKKGDLFGRKQ